MVKRLIVSFWLIIFLTPLYGQVKQSHAIVLGFLQLKEQANLGMVFDGLELEYRYGLTWVVQEHEITYQPKLGVGVGFSRRMYGAQIKFAPVNVNWTMPFYDQNGHSIRGGVNLAADYSYQIYPSLHSGHLFWTSEIGVSPIIKYHYQWDNKRIGAAIQNSLFGFTSHKQQFDPYFYSLEAKEFIVTPHKNMQFGTFNCYNHTNISLEFTPNVDKIHSFVYEFDYLGLFYGVQFKRINHNLIWRMAL